MPEPESEWLGFLAWKNEAIELGPPDSGQLLALEMARCLEAGEVPPPHVAEHFAKVCRLIADLDPAAPAKENALEVARALHLVRPNHRTQEMETTLREWRAVRLAMHYELDKGLPREQAQLQAARDMRIYVPGADATEDSALRTMRRLAKKHDALVTYELHRRLAWIQDGPPKLPGLDWGTLDAAQLEQRLRVRITTWLEAGPDADESPDPTGH